MEKVLKSYWELRSKAKQNGDEIATIFNVQPHELPANVFAMAFNDITLSIELLDHYYKIWGDLTTKTSTTIEETRKQNAERVVAIQKMVFIGIMSSIEFCAKQLVVQSSKLGVFGGRIYLRNILKRSKENRIVTDSDYLLWEGVIDFRNTLVHNNGIAEADKSYIYPQCKLEMYQGKMTKGSLTLFPSLTDWILDAMKEWLIAFKA